MTTTRADFLLEWLNPRTPLCDSTVENSVTPERMIRPDHRMDITALCTTADEEGPMASEDRPSVSEMFMAPTFLPICPRSSRVNDRMQLSLRFEATATGMLSSKKRSRRLSNSERGKMYRSRRKSYVQTLEEQVDQLKDEVHELLLDDRSRQQLTKTCQIQWQLMGTSFATVVKEYFSLFKYGVRVTEQRGTSNGPQEQIALSTRQALFLKRLMHPNVVFASSYGVQELLNQWQKYSVYHAELKYEVQHLHLLTADLNPIVLAPAKLYVRLTRRTIKEVFPHLLWNEPLVQRLIGQQLEYFVDNTFYFGDDYKIHRYDSYVHFAAGFARVLGNMKDTMALMDGAFIRQECMIGTQLEEPPPVDVEKTQLQPPRVEIVDSSDSGSNSDNLGAQPVGARIGMSLQAILSGEVDDFIKLGRVLI